MTRPDFRAAPGAAAEAYGPQPPTMEDVCAGRNAVALANEAGCDVDEYERVVLAMLHTAQAFREAENRADLRTAAECPDPDPEVGGWPGWSDPAMLAQARDPEPEPEIDL